MDSAEWLRNLARNYADGVPGMTPQDHHAWDIADEIERLQREWAEVCKDYGEARAENERLRAANERMAIGANHIANWRTDKWPDYGTDCMIALEKLGAGQEYDMWCCWNAAMCARDALARKGE